MIDDNAVDPGGFLVAPGAFLRDLPVGGRLLLRARTDWRFATVIAADGEKVLLRVCSPTGRTYKLRRSADLPLHLDGEIPIAGRPGSWRAGMARYDLRW